MVKLFQCERNTFKNTRIFNRSKIRLVPCERNHRGFKAKKNLSWITNLTESAMISISCFVCSNAKDVSFNESNNNGGLVDNCLFNEKKEPIICSLLLGVES